MDVMDRGTGAGTLTREQLDAMVVAMVQQHSAGLLRLARRHSICADDAHDAYQRGLEIFLRHARAPRSRARAVVAAHRRQARGARGAPRAPARDRPRRADVDRRDRGAQRPVARGARPSAPSTSTRSAEALSALQAAGGPRAVAAGARATATRRSSEITGWTLHEGQPLHLPRGAARSWRATRGSRRATSASAGRRCCRRSSTARRRTDELVALRPHLRNCGACRVRGARAAPLARSARRVFPAGGALALAADHADPAASCSCGSTRR